MVKMSDLIDRNDAVEAIELKKFYITAYTYRGSNNGYFSEGNPLKQYNMGLDDAIKAINNLPSAEPERKKGKWLRRKDEDCWECSECHAVLENSDIRNHNFYYCYHCGADMMDICGYMDLEKANYE